jgi:hypothetical protein
MKKRLEALAYTFLIASILGYVYVCMHGTVVLHLPFHLP